MPPVTAKTARRHATQSAPGSQEELSRLRHFVDHLKKNPNEGRKLLVEAGIYTKSGKLTKAYGG